MVFESPHIRVTAEYGTATLWVAFPGEPVNALDAVRLRALDSALEAISAARSIGVLVVRSANPAGFCAGLRPGAVASLHEPADRAAFAWRGQQVFERLGRLDAVSVALIDGPCLGAGVELALACDHRVCVARPTTHLGFPDRVACFGGSSRLRHLAGRRGVELLAGGRTISGREAQRLGLVDVACCERRGKIELRTFLGRLERRPVKPRRPEPTGLAEERRAFAAADLRRVEPPRLPVPLNPVQPFPDVVGLLGDDPDAARLIAEAVLRGATAVVCGNRAAVFAAIDVSLARGFVTPLEAEQARVRVRGSDTLDGFERAGLVFVAAGLDPFRLAAVAKNRAVVCVVRPTAADPLVPRGSDVPFPFPRRVLRVGFCDAGRVAIFPGPLTDPDTTATVAAWLKPLGLAAVVFPVAARLLPKAA